MWISKFEQIVIIRGIKITIDHENGRIKCYSNGEFTENNIQYIYDYLAAEGFLEVPGDKC